MSDQTAIPKGLHDQEVKRGHTKKPPIPYIPLENKIGDKVKGDPRLFKVKTGNKMTVNASAWTCRNQDSFLINVIGALNYCIRTKLFDEWKSAKSKKDLHYKDLLDIQNFIGSSTMYKSSQIVRRQKRRFRKPKRLCPRRHRPELLRQRRNLRRGQLIPPVPLKRPNSPKRMKLIGPKQIMRRS